MLRSEHRSCRRDRDHVWLYCNWFTVMLNNVLATTSRNGGPSNLPAEICELIQPLARTIPDKPHPVARLFDCFKVYREFNNCMHTKHGAFDYIGWDLRRFDGRRTRWVRFHKFPFRNSARIVVFQQIKTENYSDTQVSAFFRSPWIQCCKNVFLLPKSSPMLQ